MKPYSVPTAFALAIFTASTVVAQNPDTTELKTVVVSASKVPQPAGVLTQSVTVLEGKDLRARGVTRVTDALREVPGASLVQSGSFGSITSLFLRGGESRYTKVLIDGVAVNDAGGYFDFSHLTTDNIDRIEIVRGPASVLYGADAASGIVQIFTRRATDSRASVAARGGTYHSFDIDGDATKTASFGGVSLGAAQHSTNGILPFNNEYRNGTLSSNLTLGRSVAGDARISARYTTAEFHVPTDFIGQPVDSNAYRVQHRLTVGLDAARNLASSVQAHFLAGSNDVNDLSEDITSPLGGAAALHSAVRSHGYRRNVEGRLAMFLPSSGTLTLGGTYEKEHEKSTSGSGPVGAPTTQSGAFDASRHTLAYYSELLGNPTDRFSYTLSGRLDDNSDYKRFATYRAGVSVGVVSFLRLRASASNAFNAPAFSQLRPTAFTVGSPDLRPEKIRSAEVGLTTNFRPDLINISASYFSQRFEDLIQYVNGSAPTFKGSYANLTGATSNGFETELRLSPFANWRGSASYTVVEPHVTQVDLSYEGSDRVGDALIRRPTHSGSVVISYFRPSSFTVSLAGSYVGARPDYDFAQFPSPRVTLPAYTKIDLSAEVPVVRLSRNAFVLTARVENLFDKQYQEVLNFEAPGRTILFGGRVSAGF